MSRSFWQSAFPLFMILIIDAMSFGIIIPILGPMLLEPSSQFLPKDTPLNLRTFYYSLSLGLPMACMFLGSPLLGDISDQIGRKKALLIALLGIVASCLLSIVGVVFGSVLLLLVGRGLLGFMDSSESVAKAAIADISGTPKQKVLNLSFASVAGTVGFILGPLVGGLVASYSSNALSNYLIPFIVAAGLALLSAFVLCFLFQETFVTTQRKRVSLFSSIHNLISAFYDPRIRLLSLIFFAMQFAWGTYFQLISILLVKVFHYSPKQIGFFLSFLSVCFVVTLSIIIRILMLYLQQRVVVIIGLFLVALGCLIISIVHSENGAWISVIPLCMGVGISYNTILALFSEAVDKESQGRIMGVSVAIFSSAWVISSIIGGIISATNLYFPYALATAIALIGFYLAFYIHSSKN